MTADLDRNAHTAEKLSQVFANDPDASAFILRGSLAIPALEKDRWSDIDATILLAPHAIERYFLSTEWVSPFGRILGLERHQDRFSKTLRVCLENFQRFDLVFGTEPPLTDLSLWALSVLHPPYQVVWSRSPALEVQLADPLPSVEYRDTPFEEIERMVDEFWFKAAQAIVKVARNDLLVGMHLALGLVRDGLALQMIRRDRVRRTKIHRKGDWGNEFVTRYFLSDRGYSCEELLDLIRLSSKIFDELASELIPEYVTRAPLLLPHLEAAKQVCRTHDQSV